jgi:hypothetical protein
MITSWKKRKNKFNAKKKETGGRKFDSTKEADYAQNLEWRKRAGELMNVDYQVPIELKVKGVVITTYIADFRVVTAAGAVEYHETKGVSTPDFKIKWKLFEVLKDEIDPGCKLILIK